MRFNDEFQITEKYNYFDPILIADTELFVDPFAIFTETDGVFADSYDKILRFSMKRLNLQQSPIEIPLRFHTRSYKICLFFRKSMKSV